MSDSILYQWVGYLAHPARRVDIHIELHPAKELEFRREYRALTGERLLLSGDRTPFYVWRANVNKWGIQRRLYFYAESVENLPQHPDFQVRVGRAAGQYRINSAKFVTHLFNMGYLIGKNGECENRIRGRIPKKHIMDFDRGYKLATPSEKAEAFLIQQCEIAGARTVKISEIRKLWRRDSLLKRSSLDATLRVLQEKKVAGINSDRGVLTIAPSHTVMLKGEIEQKSIRTAIESEKHSEKREYMVETYARNTGWKKLAKKTFGEYCMCENCANTFTKANGKPYIEVHHIVPLHKGGEDGIWNLSVLCAHHHRMAHFARERQKQDLENYLLQKTEAVASKN